jgi:hypothetical protein
MRPIAFDSAGVHLVTADGCDLLVHKAADESPAWRATFAEPVVGIAVHGTCVLAVDAGGKLRRFDRRGKRLESLRVGKAAEGLRVARDGTAATWREGGVAVLRPGGEVLSLKLAGVTCAALSPSGDELLAATGAGLVLIETSTGRKTRKLETVAQAVAALDEGGWLVAVGSKVLSFGPGSRPTPLLDVGVEEPVSSLTVSDGGDLLGLTYGVNARVFTLPRGEQLASASWATEAISPVVFGPSPWFAVGIDKGDANILNLTSDDPATGAVRRTDPHPGRPRNSWVVVVKVEKRRGATRGPSRKTPAVGVFARSSRTHETLQSRVDSQLRSSLQETDAKLEEDLRRREREQEESCRKIDEQLKEDLKKQQQDLEDELKKASGTTEDR